MAEPNNHGSRKLRLAPAQEPKNQYLTFGLRGEAFAIEISFVKEVIQSGELTEVPMMPAFVRGVINLRGAMVPVIDLNVRFGRDLTAIARRSCVVLLEIPRPEGPLVMGIIVDSVSEVLELPLSDIERAPSFNSDPRSEFLNGVGKIGDHFVVLLDVRHVLSMDELSALSGGQPVGGSVP